ncbi:MAG TPA: hypothetical protein VGZ02_12940 [Candidatus Baltobacteraceae bacterium]|nr:hypothetical protein [Candidatus Baltobacteraceae bacterium]
MATAQRTHDHEEIRRWVEEHDGHPAVVEGTRGVLRIVFLRSSIAATLTFSTIRAATW